jgi:hypothetical protein
MPSSTWNPTNSKDRNKKMGRKFRRKGSLEQKQNSPQSSMTLSVSNHQHLTPHVTHGADWPGAGKLPMPYRSRTPAANPTLASCTASRRACRCGTTAGRLCSTRRVEPLAASLVPLPHFCCPPLPYVEHARMATDWGGISAGTIVDPGHKMSMFIESLVVFCFIPSLV